MDTTSVSIPDIAGSENIESQSLKMLPGEMVSTSISWPKIYDNPYITLTLNYEWNPKYQVNTVNCRPVQFGMKHYV